MRVDILVTEGTVKVVFPKKATHGQVVVFLKSMGFYELEEKEVFTGQRGNTVASVKRRGFEDES